VYEKSKRTVCFLISRKGASANAETASQGAIREHGKLILNMDDDMINRLILSKIEGNDPNDILFEKVDSFFMELP